LVDAVRTNGTEVRMSLRTVSWVVLALLGALVLLGSLASAGLAYGGDFPIAGVSIADVASGREGVLLGLRGARGTAAAWGAAWAVLFLAVVVGPYRKGDVATWWGILASAIVLAAVAGARVLLIGVEAGTGTPLVLLVVVLVALLLDVRRLTAPR
jgi:MFS family permease